MGTVKDGVVKRGNIWSFVIRATNHTTGASRPRWVGGFRSEGESVSGGVACRTCSDGETQDVGRVPQRSAST